MEVPRFASKEQLVAWLRDTECGRECCDEAVNPPNINVLAVQLHDRVEIYAHRRVRFHVVTRVHGSSVEAERLTEELLDERLKPFLRELHEPCNLREVVRPERLTLQEYEWWRAYRYNVERIGRIGR